MPKVTNPLLSGEVRGQFARLMIFKKGGIVTKLFSPSNPKTAAQEAHRESFRSYYMAALTQAIADLLYAAIDHLHEGHYAPIEAPGIVHEYAGAAAPAGYVLCDGASYLRSEKSGLFAVIGTTFGSVDGTHFNVPDLKGRAPIGVGTGSGLTARALGAMVGEETHLLVSGEMPAHTHPLNLEGGGSGAVVALYSVGTGNGAIGTSGSSGGGGAHNNMQPSIALNFIIKT